VAQQIEIDARLKKSKDGTYRVLCGQCGAELGLVLPPDRGGVRHDAWVMVMLTPGTSDLSVAPGYSRRYDDDGQPVYSLIRQRFMKNALGETRLDEHGRPIRRIKGRRDMGKMKNGRGAPGPRMQGHGAPLPARVECPKCRPCRDPDCPPRLNRVAVPPVPNKS